MTRSSISQGTRQNADNYLNKVLANPVVLNKILIWREKDPRFMPRARQRRCKMQRQFTIEIRVDYADNDKTEAMKKTLLTMARHGYATACLLADAVKPQIAIFSDDFFSGHEEIELLEDLIGQGKDELEAAGAGESGEEPVSAELINAVRT